MKRFRVATMVLTAAIVAGACGGAGATPLSLVSGTPAATSTPAPTSEAWPTETAWPSDSSTPTYSPAPTQATAPTPVATGSANFDIARGTAALLAPAGDRGSLAGSEINALGFDLFRVLDQSGNVCVSPTSIALALAMVRPGAVGTTATEMDKVLHNFGKPGQEAEIVALNQALQQVTNYDDSDWNSDDPAATPNETGKKPLNELTVSNAAFAQKGLTLKQAYLNALSSGFGAGVGLVDYKNDPEVARLTINRWASDRTKGRIPEILKSGDVDTTTRIALANAIYLKAAWLYPFDPKLTKTLPFNRADGSKASVPTMAISHYLSYVAGKGYRVVELPYGTSLSMEIVVPDNMASFEAGLTAGQLASIDAALSTYDVALTLPRFSADTRFNLSNALKALGMPTAFNSLTADFSGITADEPLHIDSVIHQANNDVVEEGTTASAVTVVVIGAGSAPLVPPHVTFNVDKPFLYFIRDGASGAVLFMGRIDDPSAKS